MIKLNNELNVYLIPNFYVPIFNKNNIIKNILYNYKKYFSIERGYNFPIIEKNNFFNKKLYNKFYKLCKKHFKFTDRLENSDKVFAYVSDKNNFYEVWHNHEKTSTINAVYYLNIPKNDFVTIDFKNNQVNYTYKIKEYDLIIFPNHLYHKPNRCYKDGYRISLNLELKCNESSDYIFNNIK